MCYILAFYRNQICVINNSKLVSAVHYYPCVIIQYIHGCSLTHPLPKYMVEQSKYAGVLREKGNIIDPNYNKTKTTNNGNPHMKELYANVSKT